MNKKHSYMTYAKYANMAMSFGLTMTAGILLGFYGGRWLDGRFGTGPWLMLAGMLLGVAVGFRSIWSELMTLEKELKTEKKKKDNEDQPDKN